VIVAGVVSEETLLPYLIHKKTVSALIGVGRLEREICEAEYTDYNQYRPAYDLISVAHLFSTL
jgi:hypothetical protein